MMAIFEPYRTGYSRLNADECAALVMLIASLGKERAARELKTSAVTLETLASGGCVTQAARDRVSRALKKRTDNA